MYEEKLAVAIFACKSAGKALVALRGFDFEKKTVGDQLKSSVDLISDDIVKTIIYSKYPDDYILSEEGYRENHKGPRLNQCWILDPLDGTKSFIEGFDSFCVQVAFFDDYQVKLSVVYSPIEDVTYWALANGGSYKEQKSREERIYASRKLLSYIESKRAKGKSAKILKAIGASNFIECGSYGLKICRVAEGKADVFIREHSFKIWDVAPGDLILSEANGKLTDWSGKSLNYFSKKDFGTLLASSQENNQLILDEIKAVI